jgi:diguanylate cyclase (GGDEF)-like protein/PAS domain S-box-containing protein
VRNALVREALESRLRLFEVALNSVTSGIVITDTNAHIQWANPAFTQLTGFSLEEVLGRNPGELTKSGKQSPAFYRNMWETILSGQTWHGEIVNRRKDGSLYDEALVIAPVTGGDGTIRHFVAIMQDITERKQAEEQIRTLAFYDALTQLPNRRLLNDRLGQTMAASKRSGRYGALMFLDLDNFKPLNDTYGHGVGDLLLIEAAHRLTGCVRETDTVARFGGDEFVVILSELDADKAESTAQAGIVAEKIRVTLAEPYLLTCRQEGNAEAIIEHRCAASIGVALFINHEAEPEEVLKRADIAMYRAKEGGRNSIHFYAAKG